MSSFLHYFDAEELPSLGKGDSSMSSGLMAGDSTGSKRRRELFDVAGGEIFTPGGFGLAYMPSFDGSISRLSSPSLLSDTDSLELALEDKSSNASLLVPLFSF